MKILTATVLWMAAVSANANIVYSYVGNPLVTYGPPPQIIAPLTVELSFQDAETLLSWTVSQPEFGTISGSDGAVSLATDAAGNVLTWYISVIGGQTGEYYAVTRAGQYEFDVHAADAFNHPPLSAFSYNNPGEWTSDGVLPSLNFSFASPVPEPDDWALLTAGLAVLSVAMRVRFRRDAKSGTLFGAAWRPASRVRRAARQY